MNPIVTQPVKNKMEQRRPRILWLLLLLLLGVFTLSAFFHLTNAFADSKNSREKEKKRIGKKIQMQEMNIIRLQEGIKTEASYIKQSSFEEKGLLNKLENIDLKLQKQVKKLSGLKAQMIAQRYLIKDKEQELNKIKKGKKLLQDHLQKRISAYYKLDQLSLVNITFSAQTLPDILTFHDSFTTLLTYDQNIISSYRKTIEAFGRTREALTLEEGLLHEFILREDKEKQAIEDSKAEMELLLSRIRTQKSLHKQAIIEIQKEADKLTSTLSTLRNKEKLLNHDFLLSKGTLPLPVPGRILTKFGENTTNNLGIEKESQGISISAPDGTPVKAIFKGTILHSGYLKGYGNTIVIHHGYEYYSVISRLETLLKNKNEKVIQGDDIALVGDTAMIVEDGIQIEIRHKTKTLDPLPWFDKNSVFPEK